MDQFAQTQTERVRGLQQDAVASRLGRRDEPRHFLGRQHARNRLRLLPVGNGRHDVRAFQGQAIEGAQGADGLIEHAPGDALFEQMQLKGADFLGAEVGGRASEVLGELGDVGHVAVDGAAGIVANLEIFRESATQRRHGTSSTNDLAGFDSQIMRGETQRGSAESSAEPRGCLIKTGSQPETANPTTAERFSSTSDSTASGRSGDARNANRELRSDPNPVPSWLGGSNFPPPNARKPRSTAIAA